MVCLSCVSAERWSDCSFSPRSSAAVRFPVILAVAGLALAGCNANHTPTPSVQADLGQIYPNYNAYDPTEYGQTSGYYAGGGGGR
jgi:hypothetical protein